MFCSVQDPQRRHLFIDHDQIPLVFFPKSHFAWKEKSLAYPFFGRKKSRVRNGNAALCSDFYPKNVNMNSWAKTLPSRVRLNVGRCRAFAQIMRDEKAKNPMGPQYQNSTADSDSAS